jgi:tetratricopeptide (TPR) repeat protein
VLNSPASLHGFSVHSREPRRGRRPQKPGFAVYVSFSDFLVIPSDARWHHRQISESKEERIADAVALRESGRLEEARELLVELRAEYPDDAHIAVQTAWVHDSMGLEEEAAEHYEAAIAGGLTGDELRGALLGLGSTYRTLGRDEDSERTLRQGIERFPDFLALRAFYAMTQYNLGRPREAVEGLLKLLVETSSEPSIQRYRRALSGYAEDLDRSWLER